MENFRNDNNFDQHESATRINNLLQRLFFLRQRLRATLPETLEAFKTRVLEDNLGGKASNQFYLLGILIARQGEPITMSEISRKMEIPMSTATRMVDWFVRNRYATRLPDPEDRRIVRIALTESGQEIYRAMNRYMLERAEKIISRLEASERDLLAQLLEKLIHILDQEV
jgi:DNA-binding MarR family transcriptional regulator